MMGRIRYVLKTIGQAFLEVGRSLGMVFFVIPWEMMKSLSEDWEEYMQERRERDG